MVQMVKRLWRDEEGPTAVEYALMLAGVAALVIAIVFSLGGSVSAKFTQVRDAINGGGGTGTTTTTTP